MEPYQMYFQGPPQDARPLFQTPLPPARPISLGEFLVGTAMLGAIAWGAAELFSTPLPQKRCGVCNRVGHDRRTCPFDGVRLNFSRSIPQSARCECCGSSRYRTERHHTRGRSCLDDFLDVCLDCHIDCCHDGHFQNLPKKPHACRVTGTRSYWRS
jgi:hypothetical protein